jgi:glycosyltransferase involved in cell wall biosynthesis
MISVWLTRRGGGLFDSLVGSCRELAKIDQVQVCALGQHDERAGDDLDRWTTIPVATFRSRGPRAFGYAPAMKRAVLDGDFDLIHTHGLWGYPSVVAPAWHARTGRPYVVSPHGMLDPWALRNSRWRKRLAAAVFERTHLHRAACIRALCESEAQSIRAYGLNNPICIIPNGVDLPDAPPGDDLHTGEPSDARPAWSSSSGRKLLLYLGRLHPKKGLLPLVRAWSCVANRSRAGSQDWLLAIAGWDQGGHETELKRLATQQGIPWRDMRQADTCQGLKDVSLLFLGPLFGEKKAAAYRCCDAFVLPSLSEGLPMVVLEAWAYRKPVLMTDFCNLPEGFAAQAAWRIEPDVDAIIAALNELFRAADDELQATGDRGRQLVGDRFTWSSVAREMHQVYRWLTAQGSKPPCVS